MKNKNLQSVLHQREDLDQQLSFMIQKVSLHKDWAKQMLKILEKEKNDNTQLCFVFAQEN